MALLITPSGLRIVAVDGGLGTHCTLGLCPFLDTSASRLVKNHPGNAGARLIKVKWPGKLTSDDRGNDQDFGHAILAR